MLTRIVVLLALAAPLFAFGERVTLGQFCAALAVAFGAAWLIAEDSET